MIDQTPLDGIVVSLPLHPLHRLWLSARSFVAASLVAGTMLLAIGVAATNPPPIDHFRGCDSWLSIKWDADCAPLLPTEEEWLVIIDDHDVDTDAQDDLLTRELMVSTNRRIAESVLAQRMAQQAPSTDADLTLQLAHRATLVAAPVGLLAALIAMVAALVRMRSVPAITVAISEHHVVVDGQRFALDELDGCEIRRSRLVVLPHGAAPVTSPRLAATETLRDVRHQIGDRLRDSVPAERAAVRRALASVRSPGD